jgi:hypothetical protein
MRDTLLQRALDLLKAMKILDKSRPGPTGTFRRPHGLGNGMA